MSELFQNLLFWQVMFGVLGVMAFYVVSIIVLKNNYKIKSLEGYSLLGFIFFVLSWITGGYYYVNYYGSNVKPIIISGDLSWTHKIIMETKEHVFLFLPFLSLIIFLVFFIEKEKIKKDKNLKKPLIFLIALVISLGTLIILSGVIISGAVR